MPDRVDAQTLSTRRVVAAGKSLLWVAVLGLVFFYLYALVAFAGFRDVFDPRQQMFCGSLWQCTVTIIRYGLVGDYDEVRAVPTDEKPQGGGGAGDLPSVSLFWGTMYKSS